MTTIKQNLEVDEIPSLLTIKQFVKKHAFINENGIRWMLFRDPPGLEDCLVRISNRIFLNEKKFFKFLHDQKKLFESSQLIEQE